MLSKLKYLLLTASLLLIGCEEAINPDGGTGFEIKIEASTGDFTKATDTSFEEGDEIGVFILNPELVLNNGRFKMTNGNMEAQGKYNWYEDSSLGSIVLGYYPYIPNNESVTEISFSVNADQSTHKKYTESDLMFASKQNVKPSSDAIALQFSHALSKIVIKVENQLRDPVKDVFIAEVYGAATLDIVNQELELAGSKGQIKMAYSEQNGVQSFAGIIIPQDATPVLFITTQSGKQLKYELNEEITFLSGKVRTSNIIIDENSVITEIGSEIENWTDDNDLNFRREGENVGWKSLGKGQFLDDITTLFSFKYSEWNVEIEENIELPGLYRIVNPYDNPDWLYYDNVELSDGCIYINASNPDQVSLEFSYLGLSIGQYTDLTVCTINSLYGSLKDSVITFPTRGIGVFLGESNSGWYSNINGMLTITLPGFERTTKYYGFRSLDYTGAFTGEDGGKYAGFTFDSMIDNSFVKYALFEDIGSDISPYDLAQQIINGSIESKTINIPYTGMDNLISFSEALDKTGRYTMIITTEAPNGDWWYRYTSKFVYVVDGEVPVNNMKVSARLSEVAPDMAVKIHISNNVSDYYPYYLIYRSDELKPDFNPSYDDIAGNENSQRGIGVTDDMKSDSGCDFIIQNLEPDTDYTIAIAAKDTLNCEAVSIIQIRTDSAPNWVPMEGTGTYYDPAWFWGDNYLANVSFERVEAVERYRVAGPYLSYWENTTENFSGRMDNYLEFYMDTLNGKENLHFLPFNTGMIHPEHNRDLVISEYSLTNCISPYYNNRRIAEGVYNISPAYLLLNPWLGWFNYTNYDSFIHITLPGYTDTSIETSNSKALSSIMAPRVVEYSKELKIK